MVPDINNNGNSDLYSSTDIGLSYIDDMRRLTTTLVSQHDEFATKRLQPLGSATPIPWNVVANAIKRSPVATLRTNRSSDAGEPTKNPP